jgi:hypothetical protein
MNVRFAPIVLKKSSLTAERNFSGPPVRPSCGDVRDHIASHKNDHRLSYRSWGALQWRSLLKIDFRKIFAAARFSTCVPVKQLVRIWSAAALIAGSDALYF